MIVLGNSCCLVVFHITRISIPPNTSTTSNSADTAGFEELSLDPSHPYYIHPSESLSHQLVPISFNGSRFAIWTKSMITSLSAKNKLGMVNEKFPQLDSHNSYF